MAITFYVTAHADDWQLFRGAAGFDDLSKADRVVFILTSAGDAGLGDWWWISREVGVVGSIKAGLAGKLQCDQDEIPPLPNYETVLLNSKNISYVEFPSQAVGSPSARVYFLRLPDGLGDGTGFYSTGYTSMLQLFNGSGNIILPAEDPACPLPLGGGYTIDCVDSLTSLGYPIIYRGWSSFIDVIKEIILLEMSSISPSPTQAWINSPEWCNQCGPGDHADHKATAYAVTQAMEALRSSSSSVQYGRALWPSYAVASCNENLSGDQAKKQRSVCEAYFYSAYNFAKNFYPSEIAVLNSVLNEGVFSDWVDWQAWHDREYVRIVQPSTLDRPSPICGPCGIGSIQIAKQAETRLAHRIQQSARVARDRAAR